MVKKTLTTADKRAAENLRRLWNEWQSKRVERGLKRLSQEDAGDQLDMTQGAVSQYLRGLVPLGTEATLRFAKLLGVSPQEIRPDFVAGDFITIGGRGGRTDHVRPVRPSSRHIPIINYIQAGAPKTVVDDYAAGNGFDDIEIDAELAEELGDYAFTLVVEGTSMLPDYEPGDLVIIDPDVAPIPGDDVVAKFDNEEKATLKRYRPRGQDENGYPIIELRPLNDDWPPQIIDAKRPGRIIGPVIEQRKRKRRRR